MSGLLVLSGCGDASVNSKSETAKTERIAEKLSTDLSKMTTPEIIEFVDEEAKNMTAVLETVVDGPSAEAALKDIRNLSLIHI